MASKKRSNGEGSLFFSQSKNKWMGQYTIGRKRKTIYGNTKSEVHAKLIKALNEINQGSYFEPSKLTVEEWLYEWLHLYIIDKKAFKTTECYQNIVKRHIVPEIGHIKIRDLNAIQVQRLYNKVESKVSERTARLTHIVLHSALNQAVKNDMLFRNITDNCIQPKQTTPEKRALTIEEQKKLVQHIKGHHFELQYLLCLYLGLRRGEVGAIKWEDIDFERTTLKINKSLTRTNVLKDSLERQTKLIVKEPKSKSSNRVVPIPPELVPLLKKHKLEQSEYRLKYRSVYNDQGFVFTDPLGELIAPSRLSNTFKGISNKLFDIQPQPTLHTLRHTYATRGAEQGVSIKVMQDLLGHSSIMITSSIYTHVSNSLKEKEVAKMKVYLA